MPDGRRRRRDDLRPRWYERLRESVSPATSRWSGRRAGRRWRVLRRLLSVALLVAAAVSATWPEPLPSSDSVVTIVNDLPTGTVLGSRDIALTTATNPPAGALRNESEVIGRILLGPVRQGEILTDVRLVSPDGPSAGPGRKAVAVRPSDPAMATILAAGVQVAVIGVDSAGEPVVLTADAIVLSLPTTTADAASLSAAATPVLLAVVIEDVDRVTAATLSGDIALRYS